MPTDIYTKDSILTDTDEHILLNALGGRRTCRGIIDVTTNSRFGTEIDDILADAILPIRVLLALRDGDNNLPPLAKKVPGDNGVLYDIGPKGVPSLSTTRVDISYPEPGRLHIQGTVRSTGELRRHLKRTLAKHNIPFEQILQQIEIVSTQAPPVTFSFEFNEQCNRTIAKMACNLFAANHRDLFLRNDFDPIRAFVNSGGDTAPHVALNTETIDINADDRGLGPLDHVLLVHGDAISGRIEALVTLYKHIQFIVYLGTTSLDQDIMLAYRLDQDGRGERRSSQDPQDLTLQVPLFSRSQSNQTMNPSVITREFTALFGTVDTLQRQRRLTEIIATSWAEVFGGEPEGTILTSEHIRRFANLASPRIVDALFRPNNYMR